MSWTLSRCLRMLRRTSQTSTYSLRVFVYLKSKSRQQAHMLSFLAQRLPRTQVAHLETITFDDGRSSITFHDNTETYLVTNRLPPAPKATASKGNPHPANCALNPPMHWHSKQTETFHVISGQGLFYLEGNGITASPGDTVHIPRAAHHTFRNASSEEDLVVEFTLDPSTREQDERLFSTLVHLSGNFC